MANIFTDLLAQLGVPYTETYSLKQFAAMPFKTLFGLSKLLQSYGVESEGYHLDDPEELDSLASPFIARMDAGLVIVTAVTPQSVSYLSQGVPETATREEFLKAWSGDVLLVFPTATATEPDYRLHAREEFFMRSKKWVLLACVVFLFLYLFISNRVYAHVSTVLVMLLDFAGLFFTYLLVRKSLGFKSKVGDAVCGVVQAGGCDDILKTSASKFFGLFGWSEVGFAYFSVSLLTLLMFPDWICYLAVCNLCCLPYSFWSVWYQKYRAKRWCTLCLSVQATLWLLFFCYLGGGWFSGWWPIKIELFVLGACYLGALLFFNRVLPYFENKEE